MKFKVDDRAKINDNFPNPKWVGEEGIIVEVSIWGIVYFRPKSAGPGLGGFKCYIEELDKIDVEPSE